MFSAVSWQRYILSTQNNFQNAKNRTANAVKPDLKSENEFFARILAKRYLLTKNNLGSTKNRKSNAVKAV